MNKLYFTNEIFINKSKQIHGENTFDYTLVNYINSYTKITLKCNICGNIFVQNPNNHLNKKYGFGCKQCYTVKQRKNLDEFINDANNVHIFLYDYNLVKYKNAYTKVDIKCSIHGTFKQTPASHLNGRGCPKCNISKGELIIRNILNELNIEYIEQYKFSDCKNIKKLIFDFYLPKYNICIEYDGEQHFKPYKIFGGEEGFDKIKKRDMIKNEYCTNNSIVLIRFNSIHKYDDIKKIISELL